MLDGADRWRCAAPPWRTRPRTAVARRATDGALPLALAVVSAIEDARVERLLCRLSRRAPLVPPFVPPAPDPADLSYAARRLGVLMDPALADDNHWVNKARDLFEAQPDLDDAAAFRRLASVLANDLGQMRVRFNPQQHAVPVPYRDDNSYLWDHGESAQPPPEAHALTARARGRTRRRPRMRRRRTTPPDAAAPAELARHAYPEWDYRLRARRTGAR